MLLIDSVGTHIHTYPIHIHILTHSYSHTLILTHIEDYSYTDTHSYTHSYTHIHIYSLIHIDTFAHTLYKLMRSQISHSYP